MSLALEARKAARAKSEAAYRAEFAKAGRLKDDVQKVAAIAKASKKRVAADRAYLSKYRAAVAAAEAAYVSALQNANIPIPVRETN